MLRDGRVGCRPRRMCRNHAVSSALAVACTLGVVDAVDAVPAQDGWSGAFDGTRAEGDSTGKTSSRLTAGHPVLPATTFRGACALAATSRAAPTSVCRGCATGNTSSNRICGGRRVGCGRSYRDCGMSLTAGQSLGASLSRSATVGGGGRAWRREGRVVSVAVGQCWVKWLYGERVALPQDATVRVNMDGAAARGRGGGGGVTPMLCSRPSDEPTRCCCHAAAAKQSLHPSSQCRDGLLQPIVASHNVTKPHRTQVEGGGRGGDK